MDLVLKRYDFYAGPQRLGDMFALTRGALTLRCAVSTHRLGWELRLTAGSNFLRSKVCTSHGEVSTVAEAWKKEALAQGWT
ncbi:MAG: hypothetical protein IT184_14640 [Acidobacteria bacterium]|nr:hypothetical protein [Acidobacteriota bacterium]